MSTKCNADATAHKTQISHAVDHNSHVMDRNSHAVDHNSQNGICSAYTRKCSSWQTKCELSEAAVNAEVASKMQQKLSTVRFFENVSILIFISISI
jgi:hypothetical protein